MISAILIIILIIAVCFLYGQAGLRLARLRLNSQTAPDLHPAWVVLLGVVIITTLASFLSLIMPLAGAALGLVLMGALLIAWSGRSVPGFLPKLGDFQTPVLVWGVLIAAALGILENATHLAVNPDTGIYHAQAIRWIESYAAVPGLGNLHGRFAFNSSWLVVNALFSFSFLGLQSFHLLPAALVMVCVWLFTSGLVGWTRGAATPANIFKAVLLPLIFYVAGSEMSSPGTDLPVILLAWILIAGWLERNEHQEHLDVVLFCLSVFAITLKLSAAPLMVFALLIFFSSLKKRMMWTWILIGIVLLSPWLARNVIYSGYPVYPVPGVPGLGLDWQIPQAEVLAEQRAVLAWGRLPRLDREEVLAMPLMQWLRMWYQDLTLNRRAILFNAAAAPLIMMIEFLWARWTRRKDVEAVRGLLPVTVIAYLGGLYWLLTAPDFRFGYGYLIVLFALPLVYPLLVFSKFQIKQVHLLPQLVGVVVMAYLALFLVQSFDQKTISQRIWLPLPYRTLPSEPCEIKNGVVLCAAEESWSECWYAPFPCIPKPNPQVEFRGLDFSEGFRKSE
jgi:hypothetical protein